jgi:hypothetical protein
MTLDALPSSSPSETPPALMWRGIILIALAVLFASCGACAGLFYLVTPIVSRRAASISDNVLLGSVALLGGVFGVLTLWQGINLMRGRPSRPAATVFPPTIVFVVLFALALTVGTATLAFQTLAAWLFPVWHFIAASCIPLIFLAYAAHRLGKTSDFRALFAALSWGVLGVTPIVLVIELAIGAVCILLIAIALMFNPEARAILDQMDTRMLLERDPTNLASVVQILVNPVVIAIVLLYFAVLVPVIEEIFKTLIIALGDPAQLTRARAILWGIGAGAGFALVENIFNTGTLQIVWALAMLMRVGATTMHIINGILMGRGWYAARVERRWSQLGSAFLISVLVHGLWNAITIALGTSLAYATSNHLFNITLLTQPIGWLIGTLSIALMALALGGMLWSVSAIQAVHEPAS